MDTPMTLGQMIMLGGFVASLIGAIFRVQSMVERALDEQCATFNKKFDALTLQIESQRKDYEHDRSTMYTHIETMMREVHEKFVPRELYDRDRVLSEHIYAAFERQIDDLSAKMEKQRPYSSKGEM